MNVGAGTMQTPTPNQGEGVKETNPGNRRRSHRNRRTELVQIYTTHRYFRGDTPEIGAIHGLISKK